MHYTGTCHCGAVAFAFEAELDELVRCDCSLCAKRNALMATVPKGQFRITRGEQALCLYRWNSGVAMHYFCGTCGVYVYHQRRSNPGLLSVNACCIDGFDPESLPVRRVDGRSMSTVAEQKKL
ncbi:GFA family protein [Pseudomonas sp. W03]|uniref:GFA family protein n=1 Tax=Pseudomonas sp. W03 TaxID=3090666 RepID=UPI003A4E3F97